MSNIDEELTTVNHELQERLQDLSQANDTIQNLIATSDVGLLFVDRQLRIAFYTQPLAQLFHLVPSDRGRPLAHVRHRLYDHPRATQYIGLTWATSSFGPEDVLEQRVTIPPTPMNLASKWSSGSASSVSCRVWRFGRQSLHHVVANLLTNAYQALCETEAPRQLRLTTRLDGERRQVILEVADSGSGIPEALQHRVFEPFFTTKLRRG